MRQHERPGRAIPGIIAAACVDDLADRNICPKGSKDARRKILDELERVTGGTSRPMHFMLIGNAPALLVVNGPGGEFRHNVSDSWAAVFETRARHACTPAR